MTKEKTKTVPLADYELLKNIRLLVAKGKPIQLLPPPAEIPDAMRREAQQRNAQALYDYYEMSNGEVLEATGFWVKE